MLYRLLIEKHSKFDGDSIYSNPSHIHTCIHTHVSFAGQRSGQPSVCVKMWWKSIGLRCREKYKFLFDFAHFLYKFKSNGPNVMKSVTTFDGFKSQAYTLHTMAIHKRHFSFYLVSAVVIYKLIHFSRRQTISAPYMWVIYMLEKMSEFTHIYIYSVYVPNVCVCVNVCDFNAYVNECLFVCLILYDYFFFSHTSLLVSLRVCVCVFFHLSSAQSHLLLLELVSIFT